MTIEEAFISQSIIDINGKLWENRENYPIITDIQHIGMLRQWLNERTRDDLITNEQLLTWLKIK